MKLSIIIPIYNEAESVTETVASLCSTLNYLKKTFEVEVILVNDGSTDNTLMLLNQTNIPDTIIVSHPENRGVGAALRTGFEQSTGDIILTTDFDGTYPYSAMPLLVARMIIDQADIAIASPYHRHGSTRESTGHHVTLDATISLFYRLLVNYQVRTWTSLFCAYRRHVLERLTIREGGFIASTELLVGATAARFKIVEMPVQLHKRSTGRSRTNPLRLLASHLTYMLQLPILRLSPNTLRLQTRIKMTQPMSQPITTHGVPEN